MRVASLQMTNRYMKQLNRTYEKQTQLMEQSDGDKLHRPSDDAVGYSKYLRHSVSLAENNQYQSNVRAAVSWIRNSDAALIDIRDCLATIVEKSNAAQGTNNEGDMRAIAGEMLVLVQQIVSTANVEVNGRYLFAGQNDLKPPYAMSTQLFERGLTKTLDDKQSVFFDECGSRAGDVSQLLAMKGSDNETYYMTVVDYTDAAGDVIPKGSIFTKKFMDEGYADRMSKGQKTVLKSDIAGTVTFDSVSEIFHGDGTLRPVHCDTEIEKRPIELERGQVKTLNTEQNGFFGTCGPEMLAMTGDDGSYYYVTENDYTDVNGHVIPKGSLFSKQFVDVGYKEKMTAGQHHVLAEDAIKKNETDLASIDLTRFVDGTGEFLTDPYDNDKPFGTITVDDKTVDLTFATISQYIVSYEGDAKHFSMVKENGAEQPASDEINANGIDITGTSIFDNKDSGNRASGTAAFNDVLTVWAMTNSGNSTWMSSDGKTLANNSFNIINNSQSNLAARQQVYTSCEGMLTTMNQMITQDITEVHSTDVAKLAVELMQAQTLYNLSLSVGSRVLPPSLADYL